jgi:hypothetical protein
LKPYCGLEVQNPAQALKSVKGPGNTFDINHISHEKHIKDGKVLHHLGIKLKVLPGPLTDLSVWVGFCTSSKWSRTLPSLIYFSWDVYRDPRP